MRQGRLFQIIWDCAWQNQQNDVCCQRRPRSAQSDQSLHCPHEETLGPKPSIHPDQTGADHKKFLFAVTRPTLKNCPYPNIFIGLPEFFFISCSQTEIQFFNFFCISLEKCWECAVVSRGAAERGMNWNKCHSLFNSYLESLPFYSFCEKKKNCPPTDPHSKFWVGWQQTIFLRMAWVDAQADLSLCWAYSHFVGLVMRRLIFLSIASLFIGAHAKYNWSIYLREIEKEFKIWI